MDSNWTETIQNQSDGQMSDVTLHSASDPAEYNDKERTCTSEYSVLPSSEAADVTEQGVEYAVDNAFRVRSDIERHSETGDAADKPTEELEIDHCEKKTDFTADFPDSTPNSFDVNNTTEASQLQAGVQDVWRPSNPFLGVASDNNPSTGDSVTPKSVSNSSFLRALTPVDVSDGVTDSSPLSASAPSDMAVGYSRMRESAPSSLCSASPYESPTHVASGGGAMDLMTEAAGSRPDSLYLSRSILQERERQWLAKKGSYSSLSEYDSSPAGSMDALIEVATSTPLHAQGTVAMEGDMITFVADGINELIKRSRGDSLAASERTSRTPRSTSTGSVSSSTSGWSASALSPGYSHATCSPSDQAQSPEDIPPIDPRVVYDLEIHARKVAENLDSMMQGLSNKLYKMSSCTHECLSIYKDAVDSTCDAVDSGIKSMYALMAKCEELSASMAPIYKLRDQICEIKRVLDLFEAKVATDLT